MKAEELRIGNYVIDEDGEVLPITLISEQVVFHTGSLFSNISTIRGVPLTKELLGNIGFIHYNEEGSDYYCYTDSMFRFTFDNNGKVHCSIGDDDNGFLYRKIEFLHTLQNILYTLNRDILKLEKEPA